MLCFNEQRFELIVAIALYIQQLGYNVEQMRDDKGWLYVLSIAHRNRSDTQHTYAHFWRQNTTAQIIGNSLHIVHTGILKSAYDKQLNALLFIAGEIDNLCIPTICGEQQVFSTAIDLNDTTAFKQIEAILQTVDLA